LPLSFFRYTLVMRIFLLFILPFLLCAKPFKVASYNVENLFDAAYQGTEYEEYIPGRHNWTKRMAQIKLDRTAEVICDLDADIIALQEVENESVFNALQSLQQRFAQTWRKGRWSLLWWLVFSSSEAAQKEYFTKW